MQSFLRVCCPSMQHINSKNNNNNNELAIQTKILRETLRSLKSLSSYSSGSVISMDICEINMAEGSVAKVHRRFKEDVLQQLLLDGDVLHTGVLSDAGGQNHLRMLYILELVQRSSEIVICFDLFVCQRKSWATGNVNVRQICRTNVLPRIWSRVEIESEWKTQIVAAIPASLSLLGDKRKKVVDAVGQGLGGSKLCIKPGLHGLGEAGLGKVDHGQTGGFDAPVADGVVDEAQHEGLEVVRGKEVAVLHHVALEVGTPGVDADALGKWNIDEYGEDQVIDSLDAHWCDFALLSDPRGPWIGVA